MIVFAAATVGVGGAVIAVADEWGDLGGGDSDTGARPDNDPHTYRYHPNAEPDADLKSGIVEAEWDALDPTHVDVTYISSCKLTGSGETDVVWIEDNNLGGALGTTVCNAWISSVQKCDQYYSRIDHSAINAGPRPESEESHTACHELGHTVGLTHHSGTSWRCMWSGYVPSTSVHYQRYQQGHHIDDHINPYF